MKWLYVFLLFCCYLNVSAQIYPFRKYGLIEGLPETNVNAILEDHNSFIWIATQGGVCKFDGKTFTNFSTTQGLLNNVVNHVIEDKNYHIWVATRQGVARLIGDRFEVFTEKEGLVDDDVNFVLEDRNGNIWCATNGGLSKFDGKRFTNYTTFQGLPHNKVLCLWQDHRNLLWVGTQDGLARFDGKTFQVFTEKDGLVSGTINCIFQDKKLNIWLGTPKGAVKLDNQEGVFQIFNEKKGITGEISGGILDKEGKIWLATDEGVFILENEQLKEKITEKNGLANNFVNCLLQDKNHNFWIGGNQGISKLDNRRFIVVDEPLVQKVFVSAILEDSKGQMWIGTGSNLLLYENGKFSVQKAGISVRCLYYDSQDRLWIGTIDEGAWVYEKGMFRKFTIEQGLKDNTVFTILEDDQKRIWLGTNKGLSRIENDGKITNFSENQGLADNYVRCSFKDEAGNLWFGTYKGLSRFKNGIFTNFNTKNGLANNIVLAICQDKNGSTWIATENGLCQLKDHADNKREDCFVCYTKKDGFASQNLWSVVSDGEGNIWVGHRNGVDRFNIATKKVKNYGYIDGFLPIQTFPNAFYRDKKENLWIGTFSGLVKYLPQEDIPNNIPPTLHLTDIRLFNKPTKWKEYAKLLDPDFNIPLSETSDGIAVSLPYDENSITFEFIGVHFTVPERIKYQYKLEGFDKDWSEKDDENTATYTNLPPGTYTFLLRAYNSDGVANPRPLAFKFQIDLPYWEKWWFYLAEISFFLVLILISLYLGLTRRNSRYTIILAFTTLLMLFEFVNVYIENFIESYTGNIPIYKVIANVILATMIAPFEVMLKNFLNPQKPTVKIPEQPERFRREEIFEQGNPNEDLV